MSPTKSPKREGARGRSRAGWLKVALLAALIAVPVALLGPWSPGAASTVTGTVSRAVSELVSGSASSHAPAKTPTRRAATKATNTAPGRVSRQGTRTAPVNGAQLITVTARSARATTAVVQRWVRSGGTWHQVGRPMPAKIGAQGLTAHPSERLAATPVGTYSITQAFGRNANVRHRITRLAYFQSKYGYAWGSDPRKRATYNRLYNCHCADGELYRRRDSYFRFGLVIDYNRSPVIPGAGSGFFVHVADGYPTAGCVTMSAPDLARILRWLNPKAHPQISIRVRY